MQRRAHKWETHCFLRHLVSPFFFWAPRPRPHDLLSLLCSWQRLPSSAAHYLANVFRHVWAPSPSDSDMTIILEVMGGKGVMNKNRILLKLHSGTSPSKFVVPEECCKRKKKEEVRGRLAELPSFRKLPEEKKKKKKKKTLNQNWARWALWHGDIFLHGWLVTQHAPETWCNCRSCESFSAVCQQGLLAVVPQQII